MVKKRDEQEPWMPAPDYGRSLRGLSINLLVRDVARSVAFARQDLGASLVYGDADFAVLRRDWAEWMLHADHTYSSHPLLALTGDGALRGAGIEIRLHDHDPDAAVVTAEDLGYTVLAAAADKPHGLREAYIADPDGYVWVLDRPLAG
jgi:catechol 2,3-dioxygenase-like lactoylglutathione lyase family enzyme